MDLMDVPEPGPKSDPWGMGGGGGAGAAAASGDPWQPYGKYTHTFLLGKVHILTVILERNRVKWLCVCLCVCV